MHTTHPRALRAWQHPFPTSPYPQTTACFPPNIRSVLLFRASIMLSLKIKKSDFLKTIQIRL